MTPWSASRKGSKLCEFCFYLFQLIIFYSLLQIDAIIGASSLSNNHKIKSGCSQLHSLISYEHSFINPVCASSSQLFNLQDMDPDQNDDPQTFCKKCCRFVRTPNFLIHQSRCKGIGTIDQSRQTQRIFRNSKLRQREEEQQTIPCHFCGYLQTLDELDTHPSRCEHREEQCPKCSQKFPRSLMSQHELVCPARALSHEQEGQMQEEGPIPNRRSHPFRIVREHDPAIQMLNLIMMNGLSRPRPIHFGMLEPRRQIGLLNNLHQLIHLLASQNSQMQERGLSKQEIQQFPITIYKARQEKKGEEEMCIICYCNFQEGEKCLLLPCKHSFHPECISTWLQKNPSCPVCKRVLKPGQEPEQREEGRDFIRMFHRF